ncbi:hypothetical protein DOTSEDRAFT_20008 [Dothistroma septosporum NZE10]|uniref:Uncharacterized protein n=1 Tax=Dothistroma septosporum (strain NZE10 / CBS 128990) TaxID=675120 RepID=N1Q1G1_DOTSN|nr:hypothetical protein DOTSEDRAFT_20008 [Dothistroma septosporum NZE10]
MADDAIAYELSSIDQSMIRTYIRYCLCFPCSDDDGDRPQLAADLTASTKCVISRQPLLAGTVVKTEAVLYKNKEEFSQTIHHQSSTGSLAEVMHRGRLDVHSTREQLNDLAPMITILTPEDFPYTCEAVAADNAM